MGIKNKRNELSHLLTISLISILALLLINSCSNTIVSPEDQPGRRDYEWTVDTLNIYSPAYKIWGSSPSDIWCINESDYTNNIWHFDGIKWSADGIFRFISPRAIYGFSHNEVYIGGNNGKIWRYDGSNWKEVIELQKLRAEYLTIENIWGLNSNDLYVVGSSPDENHYFNLSFIAHYFNGNWNNINTEGLKGNIVHFHKNKPDGKIYLQLIKIGGLEHSDSTIIYEYSKDNFIPLYRSLETKGLQSDIALIDSEVYFILGSKIVRRIKSRFETVLNIENPDFYQRIWGRNSKDIFLLMTNGLAHYNGNDTQYLFHFSQQETKPWSQIFGAAIFEKEVFFTVNEPPTGLKLIYHGKLK